MGEGEVGSKAVGPLLTAPPRPGNKEESHSPLLFSLLSPGAGRTLSFSLSLLIHTRAAAPRLTVACRAESRSCTWAAPRLSVACRAKSLDATCV